MISTNLPDKIRHLVRSCAVCGKKINIIVYHNRKYNGGHYFGKIKLNNKKVAEYWECNNCYKK